MGYDTVWIGGSLSDNIGDNSSKVCDDLSKILSDVNDDHITYDSPFYNVYKSDMVRWYVNQGADNRVKLLKNTFSCFDPLDDHRKIAAMIQGVETSNQTQECLSCDACFRKCAVLNSGDIFIPFENQEIIDKYEDRYKNPLSETPRSKSTMDYINKLKEYNENKSEEKGL
jgi:7-cyano-7-deazaguanine synthase in queuosine biosynthesis